MYCSGVSIVDYEHVAENGRWAARCFWFIITRILKLIPNKLCQQVKTEIIVTKSFLVHKDEYSKRLNKSYTYLLW